MTRTKTYYHTEYHDDGYGFSGYADISISVPLNRDGTEIAEQAIVKVEDFTEKQIEQKRDELLKAVRTECKILRLNSDNVLDWAFGDGMGSRKAEKIAKRVSSTLEQVITDLRFLDAWDFLLQSTEEISLPDLVECGYKWEITDENGNILEACKCGEYGHQSPDENAQLGSDSFPIRESGTEPDTGESHK